MGVFMIYFAFVGRKHIVVTTNWKAEKFKIPFIGFVVMDK